MCPFRERIYVAAGEIKTLSLAVRDGKTPEIGEDEAEKYREFRKCYLEEYYAKDGIEEDARFKNWKRWMVERQKMHDKLCKETGRMPAALVMNSTEGRRIEEEMKALMHYAQTIVKPDKQRGGPEFWTPPLFMPSHDPCCCVPPLEVQRKPEELGRIPHLEHVGVPIPVREEKGLIGYHEVPDVRKRWMRSDYLEHRASALRHKVLYLADHFPDTSFMVEGHALGSDEEPELCRKPSIPYQQELEAAWAARQEARERAQSYVCPIDSAVMRVPGGIPSSQYMRMEVSPVAYKFPGKHDQPKTTLTNLGVEPQLGVPHEHLWVQMAEVAERMGSYRTEAMPKVQQSPRRTTIRGPPPPVLVVTPAPENKARAKSFFMHRPTGSVALAEGPETEVEPLLLVRVVVGDVTIWREPPHAPPVAVDTDADDDSQHSCRTMDDLDDEPVYHSTSLPRWSLEFEAQVGRRISRTLRIENTGALSMCLHWKQEMGPPCLWEGRPQPQAFFLHRKSSICPPGQRCDLEVSFYAQKSGLFRETWLLEAEPRIAPPCTRLVLELWGVAEDPFERDLFEGFEPVYHDPGRPKPEFQIHCWRPVCPARKEVKHELRYLDAQDIVRQMEERRRQRRDDPRPKAECARADCMARREQEKTTPPEWPRGYPSPQQINDYLDTCAVRNELEFLEVQKMRFGRTSMLPPYRTLFVSNEIFEYLNPGYFFRSEQISKLREIWKKATGKQRDTWSLCLKTLRNAVISPPEHRPLSPMLQKDLLEQYQEIIMQLQKPLPTTAMDHRGRPARDPCVGLRACDPIAVCAEQIMPSAAEDRWVLRPNRGRRAAYAAAYSAMCVFINNMDIAAQTAKQRLGLSTNNNNHNNNNNKRRSGNNSKAYAKSATSSTTVKARSLSGAERRSSREVHQTKSTVTSTVSAGGSAGSTAAEGAGSDGESSVSPPTHSEMGPTLKSQYLDILYIKTYHLLCQAVDNVAAAVDSADLLNF